MVSDTPPTETLEALYRQVAFLGGVPYEDVLEKIHKDEETVSESFNRASTRVRC